MTEREKEILKKDNWFFYNQEELIADLIVMLISSQYNVDSPECAANIKCLYQYFFKTLKNKNETRKIIQECLIEARKGFDYIFNQKE